MLCLGIDSGTSSTRALVLDIESGKVLALARREHKFVEGLPHGHVEQLPQTWTDAADQVVRECLAAIEKRKHEVVAIGVSAQQHGLVVLDDKNQPIRSAKLWSDTSTAGETEELNKVFPGAEAMIDRTGNLIVPGFTAPKLLWLKRHEPHNFARTQTILLPHDYLNLWLTGERQMEYGDASGTGLMEVPKREWCQPLLDYIDKDLSRRLPPLGPTSKPAGLLRDKWRTEWGLSGDILVGAGSGDNMLGAIGTGNIKPGVVTVSLGSSGTVYCYAEKPVVDRKGELALFCDATGHWLLLACTMNIGVAIKRLRALFGWDDAAVEENVASVRAGAEGLMFLPYLQGERMPDLPNASGVLHGLTSSNMTAPHIARAVAEGLTMGLAYGLKRMIDLGIEPTELRVTGGGSKSAIWRKMIADIFGYPVVGLKVAEGAALGAAIHAAWTYRQVKGEPIALERLVRDAVKVDKKTRAEPRKENQSLYRELRARHADLTRKLAGAGYL
ncbi:MAG TPA: xylulokinase [Chthoniobacterales bacterium]|jgi:xylulokinase